MIGPGEQVDLSTLIEDMKNFLIRTFLHTSVSLTCWYYLAFNLLGFKYYFHAAAWLLLFTCLLVATG
jgi:hypothetical protein